MVDYHFGTIPGGSGVGVGFNVDNPCEATDALGRAARYCANDPAGGGWVSRYAGGAFPEPARTRARGFVLELPQRWARKAGAR